ncbi:AAA family ATPase [Phocaeicola vulgatus]|uniref:AAA family ATPase n=1 Tax=Phocaeicola vulgatus TaxID=821 RepID=UPI001C38EB78|nr:AAA family ATPase [Phocaeicola vulgatus]MBV3766148.1 AAA family ATPase [Phocaeicola vulgatus]MBV3770405.1 AAA family ATPase [Phocaeicola vulgatus]MBV3779738.1 AAA family ATPase [Phocaeicola vulgatus]MBV3788671.1 AAA family ATPase [Phocaeicola vulgatus]MBV3792922.1 AAA family ATPase [Phocaeicola vulgatus]
MFLYNKNQSIGEYVVVFPHKEGSYAQTYRVKDKDGKVKFLKLILKEELEFFQYDKSGEIIEVEIAKILKHKNLCTYVDSGSLEKDGHQLEYIVTEYIKGENLNDHIARNKELSQLEIKQIMAALLSALDYIHTLPRPIIHNEVCVENILLDVIGNYNNLKLIDFGASRFLDLKADNQSWHNQNLLYVATERLLGKSCVQSDLFSAGVVLYKLMFGVMPWDVNLAGLTLQQQVQAIIEKRSTPLTVPNIQIMEMDQNLLKIMVKALAPESNQRFASAKDFLDAIEGKTESDSVPLSMTRMQKVESESSLSSKKGNGFADVAGMSQIKEMMKKKIINILKDPERAEKFKIQIPNGMLLYGPPGCGKSFIAEKFAEEAGYNYMFVKSSDLASIYVHGSQEKIGKLFDDARKNAPAIINFDEFEALVPDRSKVNNASESGEVNEFLSQMNNCGKDRVFVIASSNRPDLIDPAVRRKGRLDQIIYIPVPDKEARKEIFKIHMSGRPAKKNIDYIKLAGMTENYVASDIAYIVNDAAVRAFEDDVEISQDLLEEVIKENTPSISAKDLQFYENIRKQLENNQNIETRRPIGFK